MGLFGGSSPTVVQSPPVPTIDDARVSDEERMRAHRRRGRAANILTSEKGDLTPPTTATSTLLGS